MYNLSPCPLQSLVLVFAHLVHCQLDAMLEFLSSVPSPTGKPALEFVLIEWCSKQHLFYGEYDRKIRSELVLLLLLPSLLPAHTRVELPRAGTLIENATDS